MSDTGQRTFWLVGMLLTGALLGPAAITSAQPGARTDPYNTLRGDSRARYDLILPRDYEPGERHPLLVTLHGATMDSSAMAMYWKQAAGEKGWIICCPKSQGATWAAADVPSVVRIANHVRKQYSVDPNQVLLHGYSDGGTWAWRLGLAYPELFKGIAVFSGAFHRTFLPSVNRIKPTAVFIVHGLKDPVIPVACARTAAANLKTLGYNVSLTIEPEKGHGLFEFTDYSARTLDWYSAVRKPGGRTAPDPPVNPSGSGRNSPQASPNQ